MLLSFENREPQDELGSKIDAKLRTFWYYVKFMVSQSIFV